MAGKQPEARWAAEAELEQFLDGLVAELESTPFEALWARFTERRRGLFGRTRTRGIEEPIATFRGPRGGAFVTQIWADPGDGFLHIFISAQADYEMYAEGNRDIVIRKGA